MHQLKLCLLYIQVILLLVILQNAHGMDNMPYILQRKKMLQEMKVRLYPQPKNSYVDKYYYSRNQANQHNYNITINEPNLCTKDKEIFLLVLVRTHYAHFKWREIIREMFKHDSPLTYRKRLIVKHAFIFANSNELHIENLVRNESKHHRDILQEDFPETYLNLMKKVVTAWKWAVNFCANAEYIMITNDEVLLDVEKVVSHLLNDYSTGRYDDHFAICYPIGNCRNSQLDYPQFRKMHPGYLYKGAMFPRYCHGWAYAIHINVVNKLYKASLTNPPFMPTDVWIGLLAEKLRLRFSHNEKKYILANVERYFEDPLYPMRPGMIAVTDEKDNKNLEYPIMKRIIKSMRRHWEKTANITIYLNGEPRKSSASIYDFSKVYKVFPIFTLCLLSIFITIIINKLLKRCSCMRALIKYRNP